MTLDQFLDLQAQLWYAFGYTVQWWIIIFMVSGVGLAGILFFLVVARGWMDRS